VLGLEGSPPLLLGQGDAPACRRTHGPLLTWGCLRRGGRGRWRWLPTDPASQIRYLLLNLVSLMLETD